MLPFVEGGVEISSECLPPFPSLDLDVSPYRPGFPRAKPSISWAVLPNVSGSELAIALYGYQMYQILVFMSTHSG